MIGLAAIWYMKKRCYCLCPDCMADINHCGRKGYCFRR